MAANSLYKGDSPAKGIIPSCHYHNIDLKRCQCSDGAFCIHAITTEQKSSEGTGIDLSVSLPADSSPERGAKREDGRSAAYSSAPLLSITVLYHLAESLGMRLRVG